MTVPGNHDGREHWADVLGCDMRADMDEIRRAYKRRWRELNSPGRSREEWAAGLERLDQALAAARREKRGEARP